MEVGIFEARNRFSELVEAAEAGEDIVVLRRGKPVIRLVPVVDRDALAQRRLDALEKIKAISAEITRRNGRPFTHAELMAARDEGKR
jgi:prevent-host-death family protein